MIKWENGEYRLYSGWRFEKGGDKYRGGKEKIWEMIYRNGTMGELYSNNEIILH